MQWGSKCDAAKQYYSYLEEQLVKYKDNNSWVTYDRLNKILLCKSDCNFNRMLSVQSNFTNYALNDTTSFLKNIVIYLPTLASSGCRTAFPAAKSSKLLSASDLVENLGKMSVKKLS